MVVNGHLRLLLDLVDHRVPDAQQLLQEDGRHGDVGLSDAHLHLQLVYDLVRDGHYLLEHADLVLVAYHDHLDVAQEVVARVAPVYVEVDLRSDFLEEDEVRF